MWTRKELKSRAKEALKRNYWKAVLVAVLVMFIGDAFMMESVTGNLYALADMDFSEISSQSNIIAKLNTLMDGQEDATLTLRGVIISLFTNAITPSDITEDTVIAEIAAAMKGIVIFGVVFGLVYELLLVNIFAVGTRRYFVNTLTGDGEIKDAFFAFGKNYWNCFKIMFLRDIKVVLWFLVLLAPMLAAALFSTLRSLLIVIVLMLIPLYILVIAKTYDYMMIPYILAEKPEMSAETAIAESKRLMEGEKWKVFVLQLSFIGWTLLSVITFDLLAIFFVAPYQCYTYAALYRRLSPLEEKEDSKPSDEIYLKRI